jgi:hypothetical protein
VLDVLAQVQASVQREMLAAITLNGTFVDLVLDPIQVRDVLRYVALRRCHCLLQMRRYVIRSWKDLGW